MGRFVSLSLNLAALCSAARSDVAGTALENRRGQHALAPALLGAAWLQAGAQLSPEHQLAATDLARQCLSSLGVPLPASHGIQMRILQVDAACCVFSNDAVSVVSAACPVLGI